MIDMYVIDNCVDDREFRNAVLGMLLKKGFSKWHIDDVRVSDDDPVNDNDLIVELDGIRYTVQTFLNSEITKKEIDETLQDMDKEKAGGGILITNTVVNEEMLNYAHDKGVILRDRSFFASE